MNPVQTWGQAITTSLLDLWMRFITFIPTLIGALLVFLLGLIIASVIGKIVERIVKALRVDQAIERISIGEKLKEHGITTTFSEFLGSLVQWFLVLVFLMAATDILGLVQVTDFYIFQMWWWQPSFFQLHFCLAVWYMQLFAQALALQA